MLIAEQAESRQDLSSSRLAVYRFLLVALDKPTPEQHRWFRSPDFRASLEAVGEAFDLPYPDGELVPPALADHESRYLACFEVGVPQPPVVLQASHYNRREPVPATVHEHVLFYKRFGARPAQGNIEPADHLSNELAFLIHLDELLAAGKLEAESVLRARRDFLARQVTRWAATAAATAEEKLLPGLYCFLLAALARAAEQDLELTQAALAGTGEGA
jgi:TorA maturation chaperone TorD